MEKRIVLTLLVVTLAAGGAFAQISVGAGGNFAAGFDSLKDGEYKISVSTTGGGFYAFFDATYVEFDIGMLFGAQQVKVSGGGSSLGVKGPSVTALTLGLYGKFPIELGSVVSLFPMLGIQYDIGLSVQEGGYKLTSSEVANYMNRFWIKLGAGADFNLSNLLYLRPSFLYGINFGTKDLNELKGSARSFYHGLDGRLALGFKF